jgi:hypothetical protein
MLSYIFPFLWIVFDVAICLRTGYMTAPFTIVEICIWGAIGAILGFAAIGVAWSERDHAHQTELNHQRNLADLQQHAHQTELNLQRNLADLQQEVASAKAFSEGAYVVVGRRLDSIDTQAKATGDKAISAEVSQLKAELNPVKTLAGDIHAISAPIVNGKPLIQILLSIRNIGPPTAIGAWGCSFRTSAGLSAYVPTGGFVTTSAAAESGESGGSPENTNNLVLDDSVIPERGQKTGILAFFLPNKEEAQAVLEGGITVLFQDVAGRGYSIESAPPKYTYVESNKGNTI